MVRSEFEKLFWNQCCDVVYNLPDQFDISNFCVFHSALLFMGLVESSTEWRMLVQLIFTAWSRLDLSVEAMAADMDGNKYKIHLKL